MFSTKIYENFSKHIKKYVYIKKIFLCYKKIIKICLSYIQINQIVLLNKLFMLEKLVLKDVKVNQLLKRLPTKEESW